MALISARASLSDAAILAHYRLVAPLMEGLFGHIPIEWTAYPKGLDGPKLWHGRYFGHYSKLSAEHLIHLVSVASAREFFSWSPLLDDQSHARFARILLERPGLTQEGLKLGAIAMRSVLAEEGREAILMCDGIGNLALWVPLEGAPEYPRVLAWAHAIGRHTADLHPDLLSTRLNTVKDGRVHIHVSTNAVGRCSALPYTLRARNGCVAAPLRWPELGTVDLDEGISVEAMPARLRNGGEVFGEELRLIRARPLPPAAVAFASAPIMPATGVESRGRIIRAAIAILSDGVPRDPDQLRAAAVKAKLLPHNYDAHEIDTELKRYIERMVASERKPAIVEGLHRMYRINEPPDGWPALPPAPQPQPSARTLALIERLHTESHSTVPEKFESAVCDAFDAFGFLATHVGGQAAPDGYADAPLGVLGYRTMLECKTARKVDVVRPHIYEAAKYREAFGAQYCTIIGPAFAKDEEFDSELQTHQVSAWNVEDLATLLEMQANPYEMRGLFAPGVVSDRIIDLAWQREHGESKRVRIAAQIICESGWQTQCAAAEAGTIADAPLLTEDAAMLMVDTALAAQGCHVNCSRDDVRAAFEWLTSPLVARAVWNGDKSSVVVTRAPSATP